MSYDPNYVSPEFASACAGYTRSPAADLPDMLARLPAPITARERAIYAAIEAGVVNPHWDRERRPWVVAAKPRFTYVPEY